MKFDIVGAGALGLLFGGGLAASGENVVFWTRSEEQARILTAEGIELGDEAGNYRVIQPDNFEAYCVDSIIDRSVRQPDWLIITTKQWHVDDHLFEAVQHLCGQETKVVCFQNGTGHVEAFQAIVKDIPVYAAVTTEGSRRKDARSVVRSKPGTTMIGIPARHSPHGVELLTEGKYREGFADQTAEYLTKKLILAGFPALMSKDIDRDIYRKLLINSVINPLTAIWRVPNGDLLVVSERRKILRQLCDEAVEIYRANQIACDNNMFEQIVTVCQSTSRNISSMLKDVLQGSPTEIDSINGRLIEMAHRSGLTAPGHELITSLIKGLQPRE
ncbi:2-dehydropantoate 2-reductase [Fontibacillus solani]|uniref:2-dehydropantoate 2-reductase n=1 Tax=Fontibacillus solani TaxID=1572857 RepID=A0A7W3SS27_9BACL|nr:2-dehydropantoate 2-reductase [Fontibacillus solani]MBA9085216.1 2-dehydropantoate 2-reductase [Fontibacillus solani]